MGTTKGCAGGCSAGLQDPRVVLIGAGSASFGLAALKGLMTDPDLGGVHVVLHDIDPAALQRMATLGHFLAQQRGDGRRVSAEPDRRRALEGADVVILSIAVQREEQWQKDREFALTLGINHYAENGGPAALFHTARNLTQVIPILRDMEGCCPNARLLNYTNPVPRINTAVRQFSSIEALGVCHQLGFGYYMLGVLLADHLGIELPQNVKFRWTDPSVQREHHLATLAQSRIRIRAAGVNHFTWAQRIEDRQTGEDLYPLLRRRNQEYDPTFEPLTRQLFSLTGWFPVPGDCHLAEYLPYTHNTARDTFTKYDIQMYDFDWSRRGRIRQARTAEEVFRTKDLGLLQQVDTERVEQLTAALLGRRDHQDESLNVPNCGYVPGLPDEAIVEVPVVVRGGRVCPETCEPLPTLPQEWTRRQTTIVELAIRGLLEESPDWLRQALALDPMVDDPDLADQFLSHYATTLASLWNVMNGTRR